VDSREQPLSAREIPETSLRAVSFAIASGSYFTLLSMSPTEIVSSPPPLTDRFRSAGHSKSESPVTTDGNTRRPASADGFGFFGNRRTAPTEETGPGPITAREAVLTCYYARWDTFRLASFM
jgi:hypothetical protein